MNLLQALEPALVALSRPDKARSLRKPVTGCPIVSTTDPAVVASASAFGPYGTKHSLRWDANLPRPGIAVPQRATDPHEDAIRIAYCELVHAPRLAVRSALFDDKFANAVGDGIYVLAI